MSFVKEDSMILDDELDQDLETDELQVDDQPDDQDSYGLAIADQPSPNASISAPSRGAHTPSKAMSRRKRLADLPPSFDKNARKREQRERDKEQQKQLLNKLIEIFEAGGGTCAVQQGQKKFPWVDLPAALIRIGCYFAGWPEKCLPKMSDKHPDRIDASTGPSQWSLKQKRAMEAQIIKGAVKVLPRPDDRAVIFEIVDEFGNVKDSTVEFSENWVRNKLLGLGTISSVQGQPQAPQPPHARPKLPRDEYSPPQNHTLALPPIRDHLENERLDLPSLAKMTRSGLHTPEDFSRSPSPSSDGRAPYPPVYPASLHPSMRQASVSTHHAHSGRSSYPTPSSQDDFVPSSRGGALSLEHGHGLSSIRSTSRQRPHSQQHNRSSHHHHHPYPQIITSYSTSNLGLSRGTHSRPSSPRLTVNTHHRHHSHSGISPSEAKSAISLSLSNGYSSGLSPNNLSPSTFGTGPSPSVYSNGLSPSSAIYSNGHSPAQPQRNPSHVPAVPNCVVVWDASVRGWILKLQSEAAFRVLPPRTDLVFWHRETDEWECLPAEPERINQPSRAMWNRQAGRWELIFPSADESGSPKPIVGGKAFLPTHLPSLPGFSFFDSAQLSMWVFQPSPGAENLLPMTGSAIVWETDKGVWSIMNGSPDQDEAEVTWSREDKTWVFHMKISRPSSRIPSPTLAASVPSPKPKVQSPPASVLLAGDGHSPVSSPH